MSSFLIALAFVAMLLAPVCITLKSREEGSE